MTSLLAGEAERCRREREREMEGIEHRTLSVNGINMHIAQTGPAEGASMILFLHGFPELWYAWRHQLLALGNLGYRCVAPDLRGYGDTDAPQDQTAYTVFHVVGDLVALLDALGQQQVFLVGHDWGAIVAWSFCTFRPDRVKALVSLSVPYRPRNPKRKPVETLCAIYGDDYYMCRLQKPGVAEADFASEDSAETMKFILSYRNPGPLIMPKGKLFDPSTQPVALPPWLSEDDLNYYASKFRKTGFTGGFNYYRCLDLNWELSAPWTGLQIKVPVKFIVGDLDLTYAIPGVKEYIHGGGFKKDVPFLEDVVVMEGVAHFVNEEKPEEISAHIYDFIKLF